MLFQSAVPTNRIKRNLITFKKAGIIPPERMADVAAARKLLEAKCVEKGASL